MKKIIILFLLANAIFAGTPYVAKLELEKPKPFIFTQEFKIETICIHAVGKSEQKVIPQQWDIEPALPEGLKIEKGPKNYQICISGLPTKVTPLTKYTVSALNNGNKVQKIPAATIEVYIKIEAAHKSCFIDNDFSQTVIADLRGGSNNFIGLGYSSVMIHSACGDDMFALVNSEGLIFFLDAKTHKELGRVSLENEGIEYLFFYDHYFYATSPYSGKLYRIRPRKGDVTQIKMPSFDATEVFLTGKYLVMCDTDENESLVVSLDNPQNVMEIASNAICCGGQTLAYLDKSENQIVIGVEKEGKLEFYREDIQHLSIADTSVLTYGDHYYIVASYHSFFNKYYFTKVVKKGDKWEQNAVEFGNEIPISIAYGNGCIAVISENQVKVFYADTNTLIFEKRIPQMAKILFENGHFLIVNQNNETLIADVRKIEDGFVNFGLPIGDWEFPSYSSWNNRDKFIKCVFKHEDRNQSEISIIDLHNFSEKFRFIGQDAVLVDRDHIAVATGRLCKIFHLSSQKFIQEMSFNQDIFQLQMVKDQLAVLLQNSASLHFIDLKTKLQREVAFMHSIYQFAFNDNYIIAVGKQNITLMNRENHQSKVLSSKFLINEHVKISVDGDLFLIQNQDFFVIDSNTGTVVVSEKHANRVVVVDHKFYVANNITAITLVLYNNGEWKVSRIEETTDVFDIVCGDSYFITAVDNTLSWTDTRELRNDTFVNVPQTIQTNLDYIFYADGKFIVQSENKLEIIDSYTRKKIGDMSIGLLKENECPPIEFEVLK